MNYVFGDRFEAGYRLAATLRHLRRMPGLLVVAASRNGIPVACEVAHGLSARLIDLHGCGDSAVPAIQGQCILLVDDGMVTGKTMIRAITTLSRHRPRTIIVAVPVASTQALLDASHHADQVISLNTPEEVGALENWYLDMEHLSARQSQRLLIEA